MLRLVPSVELGEFPFRSGKAHLEAFHLAEPSFAPGGHSTAPTCSAGTSRQLTLLHST